MFWSIVGGFGVMVFTFVLVTFYMRRREGIQPGYTGLLVAATSMACFLLGSYILRRFGVDLQSGRIREIFWLALGGLWLASCVAMLYQRRSSGDVLMDFGPSAMSKIQIAFAIFMAALAVVLAINGESRAQVFAYVTWSAWLFVMSRGRFQVREGGIITGGRLSWNHISRCAATSDDIVRLYLNKGLRRAVDLKLPIDRRDDFIHLVSQRKAADSR